MIVGRAFDMITTYLYIPDLKSETNILVSWFGASWTTLLVPHIIIIGLLAYCLYYYIFKFSTIIPDDKTLTLKQYISYFHFNEPNSFAKLLYKFPKNIKAFFALIGYVIPMTLISVSFIAGFSTTLLITTEKYKVIYKNGGLIFLFCFMGVLAIFFFIKFFWDQYKKYKITVDNIKRN